MNQARSHSPTPHRSGPGRSALGRVRSPSGPELRGPLLAKGGRLGDAPNLPSVRWDSDRPWHNNRRPRHQNRHIVTQTPTSSWNVPPERRRSAWI